MRVPLQASAEGMKNADETRCKIFRFINFVEHTQNAITYSMKKAVQKPSIPTKKGRSSSGIVKTQCLWEVRISLKDIAVERRIE